MSNLDPSSRLTSLEYILAAQRQLVEDALVRGYADQLDFNDYADQAIAVANSGREAGQ